MWKIRNNKDGGCLPDPPHHPQIAPQQRYILLTMLFVDPPPPHAVSVFSILPQDRIFLRGRTSTGAHFPKCSSSPGGKGRGRDDIVAFVVLSQSVGGTCGLDDSRHLLSGFSGIIRPQWYVHTRVSSMVERTHKSKRSRFVGSTSERGGVSTLSVSGREGVSCLLARETFARSWVWVAPVVVVSFDVFRSPW